MFEEKLVKYPNFIEMTNVNQQSKSGTCYFDDISTGMSAAASKTISEQDVVTFSEITGDKNPIHLDEKYAVKSIFGQRVAHGALIYSLISETLGMHFPGSGTILLEQTLKFLKPVYLEDKIKITASVKKIFKENNRLLITITCTKKDSLVVLSGESLIKYIE